MATTFTKIADYTVGSGGAASIDFTSIPATYTDLVLKCSLRGNGGATIRSAKFQINGSSASMYSAKILDGNGASASSASSGTDTSIYWGGWANDTNSTANTFSNYEIYIPNYAGSQYKSISMDGVAENNATTAYARLLAGLVSTSSAITSINIVGEVSFVQHSTATLYGVSNA